MYVQYSENILNLKRKWPCKMETSQFGVNQDLKRKLFIEEFMMPQFVLVSWLWGLHCWEATQKENPEKSLSCALEIKTSEGTPDHRDK